MTIRNIGDQSPTNAIRSSYQIIGPYTNYGWQQIADDLTNPDKLTPGRDQREEMDTLISAPSIPGWYTVMGCADYQGSVLETNEADNCTQASFQVLTPPKSDFIVSAFGLREGTTIKKGSRVHPWCTVQNIGQGHSPSAINISYYINWDIYRDNDTVEAYQLCPNGCQATEEVHNDNIKLGDTGTRSYRCCVDTNNQVAEDNEGNNCATMYFKVK